MNVILKLIRWLGGMIQFIQVNIVVGGGNITIHKTAQQRINLPERQEFEDT